MQEPKYENPFRLSILNGLLVLVIFAAYATYRLHKIADFRVTEKKYFNANIIYHFLKCFSSGTVQLLQNSDRDLHLKVQSNPSQPTI